MNPRSPDLLQLRHWLLEAEVTPFLELANKRKGILSQLTALSYDANPDVSTRAVKMSGLAAKIVAELDP